MWEIVIVIMLILLFRNEIRGLVGDCGCSSSVDSLQTGQQSNQQTGQQTIEGFTTKKEKAQTIYNWFLKPSDYASYRSALAGASNIVEYEDVMALVRTGNLSLNNVLAVV